MPGLLAACRARVLLARGETDPMVSADELAELRPDALDLAGLGHNAHVEDPAAVLRLLEPLAAELRERLEDGRSPQADDTLPPVDR